VVRLAAAKSVNAEDITEDLVPVLERTPLGVVQLVLSF
jgi:hypothetical protein